jgi:hypothetical protein
MTDITPAIKKLHQAYVRLSGYDVPLTMGRIQAWEQWRGHGFEEEDLVSVVGMIKKRIGQQRRRPESLKFHNLIENTERFEEDRAETNQRKPERMDKGKAEVLRVSGRPDYSKKENALRLGEIMERMKLAEQLRKWKENNL